MQLGNISHMNPKLLGKRIRLARERLSMSQGELATHISKDQKAISEYENGKRKLAATDLVEIAHVLEVPILFFFEGSLESEDLDRAVLEEFRRIPTLEAKRAFLKLARIFADTIDFHNSD